MSQFLLDNSDLEKLKNVKFFEHFVLPGKFAPKIPLNGPFWVSDISGNPVKVDDDSCKQYPSPFRLEARGKDKKEAIKKLKKVYLSALMQFLKTTVKDNPCALFQAVGIAGDWHARLQGNPTRHDPIVITFLHSSNGEQVYFAETRISFTLLEVENDC